MCGTLSPGRASGCQDGARPKKMHSGLARQQPGLWHASHFFDEISLCVRLWQMQSLCMHTHVLGGVALASPGSFGGICALELELDVPALSWNACSSALFSAALDLLMLSRRSCARLAPKYSLVPRAACCADCVSRRFRASVSPMPRAKAVSRLSSAALAACSAL